MSEHADFAQLAEDLSEEDVRSVLRVFEADVRRLAAGIGAAARSGDAAAFQRVSHGLAGAAGAVGARALETACRDAMLRPTPDAPAMLAASRDIDALAAATLADLAAFVVRLDAAPARG